jgi:hypothetical protein
VRGNLETLLPTVQAVNEKPQRWPTPTCKAIFDLAILTRNELKSNCKPNGSFLCLPYLLCLPHLTFVFPDRETRKFITLITSHIFWWKGTRESQKGKRLIWCPKLEKLPEKVVCEKR